MNKAKHLFNFLLLGLLSGTAQAHTGALAVDGFSAGFSHPFLGLDHLLVMLGVGLWASSLATRKAGLAVVGFLGFMAAGASLAFSGMSLGGIETGIMLSVVVTGIMLSARTVKLPVNVCFVLVFLFALLHGFAHGAELPSAVSPLAYALGFMMATALLQGIGLSLGYRAKQSHRDDLIRVGGWLTSACGVFMLFNA